MEIGETQKTDGLGSQEGSQGSKELEQGACYELCSDFSRPGSASPGRHPVPPETTSRGKKRATKRVLMGFMGPSQAAAGIPAWVEQNCRAIG